MRLTLRLRYALLLLSTAALASHGCGDGPRNVDEATGRVAAALSEGRRSDAIELLEALQKGWDGDPATALTIAESMVAAGDAQGAYWWLESVLREEPGSDPVRLGLANVALLLGNPDRGLHVLSPIREESKVAYDAELLRARAHLLLGDVEESLQILEQVALREPGRYGAAALRIATLAREGDLVAARQELALALRARAQTAMAAGTESEADAALQQAEIALAQAELLHGDENVELGLERMRALVDRNPSDFGFWQMMVAAHLRVGRPRLAIDVIESRVKGDEALQTAAADLPLHTLAASLYSAIGAHDEARAVLGRHASDAASANLYLASARAEIAGGQPAAATQVLRDGAEAFPEDRALRFAYVELLINTQDLIEAGRAFEAFEALDPGPVQSKFLRAKFALAENRPSHAKDLLLEIVPEFDNSISQHLLGAALHALGDLPGAELRYRAALKHEPRMSEAILGLIAIGDERGDPEHRAYFARQMIRFHPNREEGWLVVARVELERGRHPAAEKAARQGLEREGNSIGLVGVLAEALARQGQVAEARSTIASARERLGRTSRFDAHEAIVLFESGDAESALQLVGRALAESPEDRGLRHTHLSLLLALGRYPEAWDAVSELVAIWPQDPWPLGEFARASVAAGRFAAAVEPAERYLALRPDDGGMWFVLASAQSELSNKAEAIESYRRATALNPGDFAPHNNLAELLLEAGNLEDALAASQTAYRLAPQHPAVLATLGSVYMEHGLLERSVVFLEKAAAAAPDHMEIRALLSNAYGKAGRQADAERLLPSSG